MTWNNPTGRAAAQRQNTSGLTALDKWGDVIWDAMCFRWEGFTKQEIVDDLAQFARITPRTALNYVQAFWAYCQAAPTEFKGPASRLVRCGRGRWRLEDNLRE